MALELGLPKTFVRFAAVALVAVATSACSSVPSWVDPTNWMGGSDQTADADQSDASTPDLASIPDKPVAPSTVDERTQVADTLKADRADAQYSADALRGGTEPSAAPPSNAPPVEASLTPSASVTPAATDSTPQQAASAVAPSSARTATTADSTPATTAPDQAAPTTPAVAAAAQVASTESAPAVASTESAPPVASMAAAPPSDDQLGFQTSKAPPLDPSVARFVAPAVLNQYQHASAQTSAAPALTPPPQAKPDPAQSSSLNPPMDSHLRQASYTPASSSVRPSYTGMTTSASYTPAQQSQPSAVVFFPRDAAVLGAKAKAQVLAAAQSFHSEAGTGFVRVVGHSSSRTGDMPMARHLEVIFEHSQDFATAVANELVRDGVPADKVLIEAVGDSQPVYYESMPQGEAGNRRAEIFL